MFRSADGRLSKLMRDGYARLERKQSVQACDRWLEAWDLVKQLARPDRTRPQDFDRDHPRLFEHLYNWCQEFHFELQNAGLHDPVYFEHRLRYAHEFTDTFPDGDANLQTGFLRAEAEALWMLGRHEEADATFAQAVQRFPDDAWAYIIWSDHFWQEWLPGPKDFDKAEAILLRGRARPTLEDEDRSDLLERLEELYRAWGRGRDAAAVAEERTRLAGPGPGRARPPADAGRQEGQALQPRGKHPRNAPCWCGSGRKYKHCHGKPGR